MDGSRNACNGSCSLKPPRTGAVEGCRACDPTSQCSSSGLPFSDRQDFEDARRGFIATLPDGLIAGSGATPVWNMKSYEFLNREEAPATVNPSLWRQARLNAIHGLAQNLGNPSWDSIQMSDLVH